jgi:hypothetical protein
MSLQSEWGRVGKGEDEFGGTRKRIILALENRRKVVRERAFVRLEDAPNET